MLETVERQTGENPRWSVLWLHGLGADGHDFEPIIDGLLRPHWPALRFVFPHAPVRAVTLAGGAPMRAWYDILEPDLARRADLDGVAASVAQVEALIRREGERGVPPGRIVLAGFSQGGAVTLACGLGRQVPLAGLVALSTYLSDREGAGRGLAPGALAQPVFMAHGYGDPIVPLAQAEMSLATLRALGFDVDWHAYPMAHQVCDREVADLGDWLERRWMD